MIGWCLITKRGLAAKSREASRRPMSVHAPLAGVLLAVAFAGSPLAAEEAAVEGETLFFENREDIPVEFRWDLDAIFPSQEAWRKELEAVDEAMAGLGEYRGRLGESPAVLGEALKAGFDLQRRSGDILVYAMQLLDTDTRDATANELSGRARSLAGRLQEAMAFIDPEIVQLPVDRLQALLEDPLSPACRWLHPRNEIGFIRVTDVSGDTGS